MIAAPEYFQKFDNLLQAQSPLDRRSLDVLDRTRTSVMPWRGQFSPQLVTHLLKAVSPGIVLDPFCGSGTVLYESARADRSAIGIDINPAAAILASFSSFCKLDEQERHAKKDEIVKRVNQRILNWPRQTIDLNFCKEIGEDLLGKCFLLHMFGDKKEVDTARATSALRTFTSKMDELPSSQIELSVQVGDARFTNLAANSIDAVVTSPPYINVFNYHQNYRPVVEALGLSPLVAARAEIGANRKHRQNRFMTVIQYCIDMEAVFEELSRVMRDQSLATFVVGRSSKVKGVPFKNAILISAIAELSGLFSLESRRERAFLNRFGETIFEDVLVFKRLGGQIDSPGTTGRLIGSHALLDAMKLADDKIKTELEEAYERRDGIERSPRVN